MTFVKYCGITNFEDAKDAIDLGVDALGFNFYAGSSRSISVPDAQTIVRRLPPKVWMVGVFVNHTRSQVEQIARQVGLDTLQFHGDEDAEFCSGWDEWRTIKAIRLGKESEVSIESISAYEQQVDHLLFDSFSKENYGGTGEQIKDSKELNLKSLVSNAMLAGGITPENAKEKIEQFSPWGLDVASGVEVMPGKKSFEKMKNLLDSVR